MFTQMLSLPLCARHMLQREFKSFQVDVCEGGKNAVQPSKCIAKFNWTRCDGSRRRPGRSVDAVKITVQNDVERNAMCGMAYEWNVCEMFVLHSFPLDIQQSSVFFLCTEKLLAPHNARITDCQLYKWLIIECNIIL